MSLAMTGIIGFIAMILLIFLRMPVGFAMMLVGIAGFGHIVSPDAAFNMAVKDLFDIFGSYNLTVIPLFILMGQIAFHAGISSRLYNAVYTFMGHLPGGMGVATIGACAGFSAICGSTNATAATMAAITIPEMRKYRYKDSLGAGAVAAGGSLGILVPPSVIFIVYGIMTEQSIGKLFIAGIVPGIILTGLFMLVVGGWALMEPAAAPRGRQTTLKEKIASLSGVGETILLFVMVMGGLFLGLFTPTEAGGVGAFGAMVIAFARRNLSWKAFVLALSETTRISCMILMIVAGATVFGHFLAVTQIPFSIATWISGLNLPAYAIIAMIILVYMIGGCLIDALALIMLTIPIFYPVVSSLGYDPLWFGVVIVLVTQIGVITPPVGINVYVVQSVVPDIPLGMIFKGALPFLAAILLTVLLIIVFPDLVLYLPDLMR
ncbi:MAG: TRAP transporter large permease [Thermodesulfobacteriota bacterium]|nr:TRAP transporter large permease [Thermodesulfobacteriota bacterium]